ncbi:MAG: GNAT family N-acetyltransferase [Desulfobacter sp.]|nr:MAG: GNAT family N-acetyltransferase [Desulfobacter sp.]
MKIITEFNPPSHETKALEEKLLRHNSRRIEGYGYEEVIIKVMDDCRALAAGIHCTIGGGWMYIASLWVHEKHRQRGTGTDLLKRAESIAQEKNCVGIYLYTYSFQNPGFYEKRGYRIFGSLEQFCHDHSKLYMKKYWG